VETGKLAAEAVFNSDLQKLGQGVEMSYRTQLEEGMQELPQVEGCLGRKYCGGG